MNKKTVTPAILMFVILFSSGVFIQVVLPFKSSLTLLSGSLLSDLFHYIREDLLLTAIIILSGFSTALWPLAILVVSIKTFATGYTAAYFMTTSAAVPFAAAAGVMFFRSMLKIPVYYYLLYICLNMPKLPQHNLKRVYRQFIYCLIILVSSSVAEVIYLTIML